MTAQERERSFLSVKNVESKLAAETDSGDLLSHRWRKKSSSKASVTNADQELLKSEAKENPGKDSPKEN